MSHFYLSSKSKNNTRKWYFEYFIADYFPTLNKKDPVVTTQWVQQVFMLFLKISDFHPYPSRRFSLIFFSGNVMLAEHTK